jgi:MoxR-like ATPase
MTRKKFLDMEQAINNVLFEREEPVHTSMLALISGTSHFQLGVPGTAKSLTIGKIVEGMSDLEEGDYFHRLLDSFTTDDHIFGAPDLLLLKTGRFKRNTSRKLPVSFVAFIDEIFKASGPLLNSLLLSFNERQFDDEEDGLVDIPLHAFFAASNEIPKPGQLSALYDRLIFRHVIDPIQETGNWVKMVSATDNELKITNFLTKKQILKAQYDSLKVEIPEHVYDALVDLRSTLKEQNITPSDRRWRICSRIIQAEAWMDGSKMASTKHLKPLMHVLWESPDDLSKVKLAVLDIANPIEKKVNSLIGDLRVLVKDYDEVYKTEKSKIRSASIVETYKKVEMLKVEFSDLENEIGADNNNLTQVVAFKRVIKELTANVVMSLTDG